MNKRLLIVSLLSLAAHGAASARTVALPPVASTASGREAPQARISYADLDLRHAAGAEALRRRMDHAVIELSGGSAASTRSDVVAARARTREQADAIIAAAQA